MRRSLSIFLLLCAASPAWGATLTGAVTDSATGQALPYVSVVLPDLRRGTFTDLYGRYTLDALPAGAWRLQVSFIGYRTFTDTLRLNADTARSLNAALPPAPLILKPDVPLLKRTLKDLLDGIARKDHEEVFHARYPALRTYRFAAHGTQTLYGGKRAGGKILARIEYDGEGYYKNPDRIVQAITAYRALGAAGRRFGMHPGAFVNIRKGHLNGRDFNVGLLPLEPDAHGAYRYRLLDNVQMGDIVVYRIRVIPRKKRRPALEGDVWISGNDFSLVGYDLKINKPLRKTLGLSELRTYQENALYYDRYWLPVRQTVRIKTASGDIAEQITHISDYALNIPLPDSLFAGGPISILPGATERSPAYWSQRASRLQTAEQNIIRHLLESNTLPAGWKRLLSRDPQPDSQIR